MVINNVDPGSYSDPKAGAITQDSLLSIGNPSPPSGTGKITLFPFFHL